jgi:hypothetical protein
MTIDEHSRRKRSADSPGATDRDRILLLTRPDYPPRMDLVDAIQCAPQVRQ